MVVHWASWPAVSVITTAGYVGLGLGRWLNDWMATAFAFVRNGYHGYLWSNLITQLQENTYTHTHTHPLSKKKKKNLIADAKVNPNGRKFKFRDIHVDTNIKNNNNRSSIVKYLIYYFEENPMTSFVFNQLEKKYHQFLGKFNSIQWKKSFCLNMKITNR